MTNVHLKMIAKKYYFCFFILLCVGGSYEQCQNGLPNYVPSDYKYVKSMENFYKVHTKVAAWQEAKLKCEEEEAMLFYPRSTAEYHAVSSYVIEAEDAFPYNNTDAYGIWIGVSSLNTDKFLTLDGFPMEAVFDRWGENEPNGGSDEECLALKQGGYLSDWPCQAKKPFMCKKTLGSVLLKMTCSETSSTKTVQGFPMEAVFDRWGENEPNGGSDEECLALKQGGYLSDWPCQAKKPFMCKKTLGSVLLKMTCSETSSTKTVQDIQSEKYYEGNSI